MKKSNEIEVSIIMSTYNESISELSEAIYSILNQTFKNFEFIIITDNPNNKQHIDYINKIKSMDERIVYLINKNNIGLANSLNKGIEKAKGKYIVRMDADDISMPDRIQKEYDILSSKNVDIVSTNKVDIDENGEIINLSASLPQKHESISKVLKYNSIIFHPTVMFKKESLKKIKFYRDFPCSQDYDMWLRAIDNNLKFEIIDEYLLKYRNRSNNISNSNAYKQWLMKKYICKLSKERKKNNNIDTFSEENMYQYLKKNGLYVEANNVNFKKGIDNFYKFKEKYKSKKYVFSVYYLCKSIFSHREIACYLYNFLIGTLIKRSGVKS